MGDDARQSTELRERIEQSCRYHGALENYFLFFAIALGLARRLGLSQRLSPLSGMGRRVVFLFLLALVLGPALAVAALRDEWAETPLASWFLVAGGFAFLAVYVHGPLTRAIDRSLSLHRVLKSGDEGGDGAGWRELLDFGPRWFRLRYTVAVGTLFSLGIHLYLYYLEQYYGERELTLGTVVITSLLLYQIGEMMYAVLLLAAEALAMPRCRYSLYRLSPLDSLPVRRTLRGASQLVLMVSLMVTGFILGFVLLVGDRPLFWNRVGLLLLALTYLVTAAALLAPRLAMRAIAARAKEHELRPLQEHLSALAGKGPRLTEEEYRELKRMKELYDMLFHASEEVLPLRAVGRLLGALLFPTMTFLLTRFGEQFLHGVVRR